MEKPIHCDCDVKYIKPGEGEATIKAFFASHPFMAGYLIGYSQKTSPQRVIELLGEVVQENYNNPKGWGRR